MLHKVTFRVLNKNIRYDEYKHVCEYCIFHDNILFIIKIKVVVMNRSKSSSFMYQAS